MSLKKYELEIANLMHDHELDILGLSKTRLSKDISDSEVTGDMISIDTIGTSHEEA